ncbi:argonaute-like protein [Epithele typhae]|uniref:argonaute-like protein n=1 Tax=Epithele typhae TaxID=378194 RepID=UPI0020074947|nr:argonaute-like protein [Epithele typhae]KAH9910664.1 argonaute-like protein [Epithele typhae]
MVIGFCNRGRGRGDSGDRGRGRGDSGDRGRGRGDVSRGRGRGDGRGSPSTRGSYPPAGGGSVTAASTRGGIPEQGEHVTAVGVKRPSFGTSGSEIFVKTNHFEVSIPEGYIHHYDEITGSAKPLPPRMNREIVHRLQTQIAPGTFTPRAVYDGRANLYSTGKLVFDPPGEFHEFRFSLVDQPSAGEAQAAPAPGGRPPRAPRMYTVALQHVAEINPEVLARFLQGKQSQGPAVLTAITALNVAVRMEPYSRYPFNTRSFFTNQGSVDIGSGMHLWRGYFQSVRPAIGRMLINVDISAAVMYAPGPMIQVALAALGRQGAHALVPAPAGALTDRDRVTLERFFRGVRVQITVPQGPQARRHPRVVQGLSRLGANAHTFTLATGQVISVAQHFQNAHNYTVQNPGVLCVQIGTGVFPMECCFIPPGQILRKQLPPEKTDQMVKFSTQPPQQRLASVVNALGVLDYGQSEYVRQFGMHLASNDPLTIKGRVLDPPTILYSPTSKMPSTKPTGGRWNLIDKQFYRPMPVNRWAVVIYEREQRYTLQDARMMVQGLITALEAAGMTVAEKDPIIRYHQANGSISEQLHKAGADCVAKNKRAGGPNLIVVVLPQLSADMYAAVKHFGDCKQGVATQCLASAKCKGAKPQYYANVSLKINVKLGGINSIADRRSVPVLNDPVNPTIVMGADIAHPATGTQGRPSFASLVGNIDSNVSKYTAECRVQRERQETIDGLEEMAASQIEFFKSFQVYEKKTPAPTRLIFYRDGVSEGEFQQVLDYELPQLKRACERAHVNPKITLIIVAKGHHVRFFPRSDAGRHEMDGSGNCPAGLVVDNDITHPLEFDFYLQSHRGYGTSRSAHYSVLYDENGFTPDSIQSLSFALCHVFARATLSVSIPAPVYCECADSSRYTAGLTSMTTFQMRTWCLSLEESGTLGTEQLEEYRAAFKPLHSRASKVMYFC